MAAVPDAQVPELLDLWDVRVPSLERMLDEETRAWREHLEWDFHPSADLVRRFVEVHALNGYALLAGDDAIGYCYFVCEEHKGLIGDLYVRERFRSADNEYRLLAASIEHLIHSRHVRRIESQLMLARWFGHRPLPAARYAHSHLRNFMMIDAAAGRRLAPRRLDRVVLDRWSERRQDDSAQVIAAAYRGHIDSEINDQYRSPAGARRFLFNIVQYPGCGTFYPDASWVALERGTGKLVGVCLTSLVASDSGHITQICVSPAAKGRGIGYELLRRSLLGLGEAGARRVSLTVTAANENAVGLYRRVGFKTIRQFPALVWEGFV